MATQGRDILHYEDEDKDEDEDVDEEVSFRYMIVAVVFVGDLSGW